MLPSKIKSKRSAVWCGYTKVSEEAAKCNICGNIIVNKGNTTNLKNHMKSKHPFQYAKIERESCKVKQSLKNHSRSPTLLHADTAADNVDIGNNESFTQKEDSCMEVDITEDIVEDSEAQVRQASIESYTLSKSLKKKVDQALSYFITVDMQPYNLVERKGFKAFVKVLGPSYTLPSRKTVSNTLGPALYNKTRDLITLQLKKAKYFSYTTDCWTSTANQPFLALTCHFIDDNELKSACLGCHEMSDDHTGENIADALISLLYEWDIANIEIKSDTTFTTDYGSNIIKAVELMNVNHIPCFGHSINTAVNSCFELTELQDTIKKVKKIQSVCAHSWKINRELKNCQENLNLPKKRIPSYSKTRWWSLLNLFQVIIEQQLALLTLLRTYNKGEYRQYILNPCQINLLEDVVKILVPIKAVCENLSGEKYVTCSCIMPLLRKIKMDFNSLGNENTEGITSEGETMFSTELTTGQTQDDETQIDENSVFKSQIIYTISKTLEDRYINKNKNTCNILQKCTFLDPRFKDSIFSDEVKVKMQTLITEECINLYIDIDVESNSAYRKSSNSGLATLLRSVKSSVENSPQEEIQKYLKYAEVDIEVDPLIWWKDHTKVYPRLSQLALKYLCIQATSVPAERVFSKGGLIVTDNRSSLTGDHVEQLVFMAMNEDYVPVSF